MVHSCCVRAFHPVEKAAPMTAHTETDLQPSSMTAHEPRAATKEAWDFTGQGIILLVEDEQSLRSLIVRGLRSRGYSVIEASNGVAALEALEQSNVDLVKISEPHEIPPVGLREPI
jgi:two-component system cell cycle sensor histidine kinase/response regulator CckA